MNLLKPILYSCVSVTQYLQDLYAFRKSQNAGFTYESWAAELGFKSRSFITMILNKERNITPHFIEVFCESMAFSSEEKSFFSLLVNYSQSVSEEEKSHNLDRLLEIQGKQKDLIQIHHYSEFLSSTFLPQLLVLLSFKDLDRSVQGLSDFLKKDHDFILQSLQQLQKMNLAFLENETWLPTKKSFKVPKKFGSKALEQYHNHSLNEAIAAQKQPPEQRRFRSLLLPLSESDYENLLLDIEALVSKAVAKYDSDTLQQKKLYKLNVNVFAVTDTLQTGHNPENETRLSEKNSFVDNESTI